MSGDCPPCDQCGGIRIARGDRCLAHVGADERGATLKRFAESGELDVRGVTISEALFREIADAAPHDADGRQTFSWARFDGATFEGEARFDGATFKEDAWFDRVTFKEDAWFRGATFKGARFADPDDPMFDPDEAMSRVSAGFSGATFKEHAWFDGATFEGGAPFNGATFKRHAGFDRVTFKGAQFDRATFEGGAGFEWATFEGYAGFELATFKGGALFSGATFKGARFEGEPLFEGARTGSVFKVSAGFSGATFKGYAGFELATFKSYAEFHGATFKSAHFDRATFKGGALFTGVTFEGDAGFDRAIFKGAQFDRATFKEHAWFDRVTFKGYAGFELATFKNAQFSGATFEGGAWFTEVTFEGDARFDRATFKGNVPVLGPFAVEGRLDLDAAQFASPVRIEADASELTCRRGAFPGGVRFELRRALVRLDDTDLSVPSLLTGPSTSSPAGTKQQPSLLSLQRANVAGLVVGNVNLAACRFAGAHNLDKLRLEAGTVFGLSPAVAGWERRQIIAEEAAWRADRARPGRWNAPEWPDSDDKPEVLSPGAVAVLYRALRKSREDAKDEPGAADFYYGEMEMRRHDRGAGDAKGWRGRASRIVLTAYWLVSGYGLRAWRSLAALAVVTALFAAAFHFVGFTRPPEPASYWTSLLYAFRSTISLTDSQVTLTAWGSFLQALLRITGPVLLGLMLLALRSRVKR
jgi:uncharacterized protein YjbI with pentapeptide repeats